MKPKSPIRRRDPDPNIDPAYDEMLHSLFDGRAKHRVNPNYEPARQEKPRRAPITLATRVEFLR